MVKTIILLSLSILLIECSDSSTNYNEVELDKEFNIKEGDSVIIFQERIVIKFKNVKDDSRCPKNAVCVWEGNAAVVLELKNSNGDTFTSILNTSIEPKEVKFSNFIIELKGLNPYPILDTAIVPKDYIVTLLVKK